MQTYLSPRGRLGRAPYAIAMLVVLLLLAATLFVPALGWVMPHRNPIQWSLRPGLVPAFLLLWPLACLQLNRLRDMGFVSWWALLPVVILTIAGAIIQFTDSIDTVLIGWMLGGAELRSQMVWTFPISHLAFAWAMIACLGGVGWLSVAPSRVRT